jgi:hypothetical protein
MVSRPRVLKRILSGFDNDLLPLYIAHKKIRRHEPLALGTPASPLVHLLPLSTAAASLEPSSPVTQPAWPFLLIGLLHYFVFKPTRSPVLQ